MIGIPAYSPTANDFSTNGLGLLLPEACYIDETGNGKYELTIEQPIYDDNRWAQVVNGTILKAAVPKRESPLYEITASNAETSITRNVYKVKTNGGRLRLRQKPSTSAKILGMYKVGTEVVQLEDNGEGWYHVTISNGGATGWMYAGYLEFVRQITETITSTKPVTQNGVKVQPVREQLFRVYSIENDTEIGTQTIKATHIFYDIRGNLVNDDYAPDKVPAATAARHIWDSATNPHDFELYIGDIEGEVTGEYGYNGIAEALLTPDEGIIAQSGCLLVRDNFDVFLLPDTVRDMGVTIRRGKNLIGAKVTLDDSNVVTRIVPRGKDKEGNWLYLDGVKYVDSSRIGDYPIIRAKVIDYDVTVSDSDDAEFKTNEAARAELKRRAEADFVAGIDLPTYGMEVNFVELSAAAEYAKYAALQSVHLYDTVTVIDELIGLKAKLRVTGYRWNVLTEQYDSVTLGELQSLKQITYGYDIVPGTVSGSKIIPGSVDGSTVLRNMSVNYAKIAQAAIEQLSANAITAMTAHINEIVAGNITTDQLYVDLAFIAAAQITAANIDKANIDWAQINTLTAQIAEISRAEIEQGNIKWAEIESLNAAIASIAQAKIEDAEITSAQITDLQATVAKIFTASIGSADIGFAQIKDLITQQAIITEGVGGQLYIARLAVTEANMVSLSVGELMVKGEDGHFYSVGVGADGKIKTTLKQIVNGDIANQTIHGTQKLIEGSITAQVLNVQNIFGDSAIIRELIAANLDVDTLFAREATIKALNAVDIRGNEYLKLSVEGKSTVYRGERPPAGGSANDLFIQNSTGYTFQRVDAGAMLPEFYIDETGILYYRYADGQTAYQLYMDANGDLYIEDNPYLTLAIGEDGTPEWWTRVKDSQLEREAQEALAAAKAAQDAANQNASDMANIVTQFNSDIADLQNQIDGNITSWFISGTPTAGNYPANQWTTDELKNVHLGDLCYDEDTGYCYRWQIANGAYAWVKITDTDVTKALADAAKAQDTADDKRRVFVATPTPPYDVGDIWAQGAAGDIMRCQVAKVAGQGYAASDWVKASKYTDDTKADQNAATITEHAAAIDLNKRNIELRVTSETFNETVGGLRESISETDARIDVKAGEITESVSKTYATKSDLSSTNQNVANAQAAIKNNAEQITLKVSTSTYNLEKLYRGPTAPSTPYLNMAWLDTSLTPNIIWRWNGSAWDAIGAQEVKTSGITINDKKVAITTENFLLQLLDPANNESVLMEMSADGNVGFNKMYAEEIVSDSVAQAYMGPSSLYIDPSYAGDDPAYFRSLSDAMKTINYKYLREKVNISLYYADAVYDLDGVTITGLFGPGNLTIYGASKTVNAYLNISGCCSRVYIYDLYLRESRSEGTQATRLISIDECRNVEFSGCTFDGNNVSSLIVNQSASSTSFTTCEFYNATRGIQANRGDAFVNGCKGSLTTALTANASTIYASGTIPGGNLTKIANGQIYSDGTTVDYGSATPPVQPEATATFTADTTRTHRGSWRTDTQDVIQGAYAEGGYDNVQNWNYGGMWFSMLRGTLSGKTVKSATITLKRIKAGANAARSIYLCVLTNTSPSGSPVIAKEFGAIGTLAVNTQGTFALPADAVQGLVNGTYGALALYETPYDFGSGNYSRNYMRIHGANSDTPPVLTVVYS